MKYKSGKRLWRKSEIKNCEGEVYLSRWVLFRIGEIFQVYLHRFSKSDEDRALHDHPWSFLTVILNNGYYEWTDPLQMGTGQIDGAWSTQLGHNLGRALHSKESVGRWYPAGTIAYRPALWRHRIEILKAPTWTLVFRFRRFRTWGFWNGDTFTQWEAWWKENCG